MCYDERITTGKAVRLTIKKDNDFTANGRDIALFTCECLDENGRIVPDAAEFVQFSVNSPAKIIATGSDHCDHNRISNTARKMYMGKIRIAVKPQMGQKELILTAMSDNCGVTRLKLQL